MRRASLVLGIGLMAVLGSANPVGAWDHHVTVANGTWHVQLTDTDLVAAAGADVHALLYWYDNEQQRVGYVRSSLGSNTSGAVLDSRCQHPEGIDAQATGTTTVVAACSYENPNDVRKLTLVVRRYDSGGWHGRVAVNGSTHPSDGSGTVAIDGSLVVVGWTDRTGGIYVARSTNGGESFKKPVRLGTTSATDSTYGCCLPNGRVRVAIDGDRVAVAWVDGSSNGKSTKRWPTRLRLRRSSDRGASFSSARTLVSSTMRRGAPAMALEGSRLLIVYVSGKKQARLLRSTNAGSSFHDGSLSDKGKATGDADLALDGTQARATWRYGSHVYLRRSADTGTTWAARENTGIVPYVPDQMLPNVALRQGETAVLWTAFTVWGGLDDVWVEATTTS
ncbi:MAG: hypothetical protein U0667_04570 [Chloroflexota bacterium]